MDEGSHVISFIQSDCRYSYILHREHCLDTISILLVWTQLFCYGEIMNRFACLVEFQPVKQEVSRTVILPRTE